MKGIIEYRPGPWAIREEALAMVRSHVGQRFSAEAAEQIGAAFEAASAAPAVTGGVAVLPIRGMITPGVSLMSLLFGGTPLRLFRQALRNAVASDEVGAIVLDVDSPGGLVDLVPETAAEIRAAGQQKKVVAVANTMAASAAYYLASQASELVVTPSGEVGSVGVYCLHDDYSGMWEQVGIKPTYVYAGAYKVELNPDEPLSEDARAYLQAGVDEVYADFVSSVAKGRGVTPAKVRSDFGEGRMLSAKNAVSAGMADRVETFEDAVSRLVGTRKGGRRADAGEQPESQVAAGDPELLARIRDELNQTTESLKEGK